MGEVLWAGHYGRGAVGGALWARCCGQGTMGEVLWAGHYE